MAAGTLRSRDLTGENTINRLRPTGVKTGEITFTFDGYSSADASTRYDVKAAIVPTSRMKVPLPHVRPGGFRDDGFALVVTRGEKSLTASEIRRLEFMIQVVAH